MDPYRTRDTNIAVACSSPIWAWMLGDRKQLGKDVIKVLA